MSSTSIITSLGNPVVQNLKNMQRNKIKQVECKKCKSFDSRFEEVELSPCLPFGAGWFFSSHISIH